MIIDLQRRIHEAGRIRIGQQVASGNGRSRPEKLETFRLTSSDRARIVNAAKLYGGTPREWQAPAGKQWEVITTTDTLDVIIPPGDMAFSQHYELWSGGGCQRRCDGVTESISDGACLCDPDKRECAIHSRLSVMLRDLAGLGAWRLDTQGYYAAVELQGAVSIVQMAAGRGQMLPARLRLEQRMVKRPGEGTKRFAVPVLDIEVSPAQLLSGHAGITEWKETAAAIEAPQQNGATLTPVPQTVPEHPTASIAEQSTTPPQTRKRTAQAVPRTGLKPRTVAQAKAAGTAVREEEPPPPPEPPPDDDMAMQNLFDAGMLTEEKLAVAMVNDAQLRKLGVMFRERGFGNDDRQARLDYVAGVIGHAVESSKELTKSEASAVIDSLES